MGVSEEDAGTILDWSAVSSVGHFFADDFSRVSSILAGVILLPGWLLQGAWKRSLRSEDPGAGLSAAAEGQSRPRILSR